MTVFVAAFLLAQAPKPLADLPFEYEPGRIWLKATVNGQPVRALLDTGANGSYADEALLETPGVVKGGAAKASSVSGDGAKAWAVKGLTLTFDGTTVRHEVPFALPLPELGGKGAWVALGVDFVARYVVEIDYPAKRLRIYDKDTFEAPKDHVPMRLTFLGGYATFRGKVQLPGMEERKLNVLFDTGSPLGLVLTNRLVREDRLEERFADAPKGDLPGPFGGANRSVRIKDANGGFSSAKFTGEVALALSPEGALGKDAAFDALMGDQIFSQMHVVLDYSRLRMYLKRVAP